MQCVNNVNPMCECLCCWRNLVACRISRARGARGVRRPITNGNGCTFSSVMMKFNTSTRALRISHLIYAALRERAPAILPETNELISCAGAAAAAAVGCRARARSQNTCGLALCLLGHACAWRIQTYYLPFVRPWQCAIWAQAARTRFHVAGKEYDDAAVGPASTESELAHNICSNAKAYCECRRQSRSVFGSKHSKTLL